MIETLGVVLLPLVTFLLVVLLIVGTIEDDRLRRK